MERALAGTGSDGRLNAAVDFAVADLLKERAAEYLAEPPEAGSTAVVVGGEEMATITTGNGLIGNGSPELPVRIADPEALAIARIARIIDQAAALIGKTIDIAMEQGSIWTTTTELEFVLLNAAPADPASVVESLAYVNSQTIATPSAQYAIILKLPTTEDPGLYRIIMRDSTGAVVDGVLVGSCIPIVLPASSSDVYYRIDDPLSGGMLLRDTVGEWATIEAEKDVRIGARSQWAGGYKDSSIPFGALEFVIRDKLNRIGMNYHIDELEVEIPIAMVGDNGTLTFPAGQTIANYAKLYVQVEVMRPAAGANPNLFGINTQTLILTAQNISGNRPHPLDLSILSLSAEGGTEKASVTDSIGIDIDIAALTWRVSQFGASVGDVVTLLIYGERQVDNEAWVDLIDTPAVFGDAGTIPRVNPLQTALEFFDLRVDDTPVNGLHLQLDTAVDGVSRIRLVSAGSVAAGTLYGLLTTTPGTPTEADFTGSDGFSSTSNEVEVPIITVSSYLHFASTHDDIAGIMQAGSAFPARSIFSPVPASLMIGGVQYYVYSSQLAFNPTADARDWILTR